MSLTTYVGLAACSHSDGILCTSTFDSVAIVPGTVTDLQNPGAPVPAVAAKSDVAVMLTWPPVNDDIGVSSYEVARDGNVIATLNAGTTKWTDAGLTASTAYSYTVKVSDLSGKATLSAVLQVTTDPFTLPSPWQHADVGATTVPGTSVFASNVFTVSGAGADIGGTADAFQFTYQPLSTDGQIIARLSAISSSSGNSIAGVMIRQDLTAGSPFAAAHIGTAKDFRFWFRAAQGIAADGVVNAETPVIPCWIKVRRVGDLIYAYKSVEGKTWDLVGVNKLALIGAVDIGLVATSRVAGQLATAAFDNVRVQSDSDGDKLFDDEEINLGTNLLAIDTDGDGISDYDEVRYTLTDPARADLDGFRNVIALPGSSGTSAAGTWRTEGQSVYASDLQGALDYILNVPASDVYRLVITARDHYSRTDAVSSHLWVYIDGQLAADMDVVSAGGAAGTGQTYTPWLTEGTHTVRVVWENIVSGRSLQIDGIVLQSLGGPNTTGNGVKDWVNKLLAGLNGVDVLPTISPTSPACIEGSVQNIGALSISGGAVAKRGVNRRWYADVNLDPFNPTLSQVVFDSGRVVSTGSIRWVQTNTLKTASITVRKGDSLLLTALQDGVSTGSVSLAVQGVATPFVTTVGQPVAYAFNTGGTFTA